MGGGQTNHTMPPPLWKVGACPRVPTSLYTGATLTEVQLISMEVSMEVWWGNPTLSLGSHIPLQLYWLLRFQFRILWTPPSRRQCINNWSLALDRLCLVYNITKITKNDRCVYRLFLGKGTYIFDIHPMLCFGLFCRGPSWNIGSKL